MLFPVTPGSRLLVGLTFCLGWNDKGLHRSATQSKRRSQARCSVGFRFLEEKSASLLPNRPRKLALEEEMFDCFIMLTKNASLTSPPIPLNKIVFGEN